MKSMTNTGTQRAGIAVIVLICMSLLVGCAQERTPEAFCAVMRSEKERIVAKIEDASDNAASNPDDFLALLGSLATVASSVGDLATYFKKLSEAAPPEIEVEMEQIASIYDERVSSMDDAFSNPLGALGGAFVDSFRLAGPTETVNDYALNNCNESL